MHCGVKLDNLSECRTETSSFSPSVGLHPIIGNTVIPFDQLPWSIHDTLLSMFSNKTHTYFAYMTIIISYHFYYRGQLVHQESKGITVQKGHKDCRYVPVQLVWFGEWDMGSCG